MEKDEYRLLEGRIRELSETAYQRDVLKHTGFLSLSEQAVYHKIARELPPVRAILCGGHAEADRAVLCFLPSYYDASPVQTAAREAAGITERAGETSERPGEQENNVIELPAWVSDVIACVRMDAAHEKFAEPLTHRDYLGALMNLGIERAKTGDILADGTGGHAFVFCLSEIAPFICSELLRVRHTSVRCSLVPLSACDIVPAFENMQVNVASARLDAVIAAVWKLSRSEAASLIAQEAVFADGRNILQPGAQLKEGARVSVRGHGKFIYEGMTNFSRKGRMFVQIRKFV